MEIIRWYTGGATAPGMRIDYNDCTRNALIRFDAIDIETMSTEFKKQLLNENIKYNLEEHNSTKVNYDIRISADSKEEFERLLIEKLSYIIHNSML